MNFATHNSPVTDVTKIANVKQQDEESCIILHVTHDYGELSVRGGCRYNARSTFLHSAKGFVPLWVFFTY
jgi:hypothetical protein